MLLGWIRAILLQLAHPLVAAGVAEHSSFRGGTAATFARLHHTVGAMLALTFGGEAEREQALDAIRAIHRRVHGTLPAACGPFPAGAPYSAEDPDLLLWVHATLVDSIVRIYEQLVTPLSEAERDQYCADSAGVAIALGARSTDVPVDWRALQEYVDAEFASGSIAPGDQARALAAALLSPVRGPIAAPVTAILTLVAAGLLPERIRHEYGFSWNRRQRRLFDGVMTVVQIVRRGLPRRVAWWPEARSPSSARGRAP